MRAIGAYTIVISIIMLSLFVNPETTGYAVATEGKPDLTVAEIVMHGVDKETQEMFIVFTVKNSGSVAIKKGTAISVRMFVRYTAPPVKQEYSGGTISTAEVFIEEVKATYVLKENLVSGETITVLSPPVPILLSTVRFFEKYNIKNRITIEVDNERRISEENEKNNQKKKWYYMQEWTGIEEEFLEPIE